MGTFFPTDGNIFVVAEIANAAQGIAEDNLKLIDAASEAEADGVKLQFYKYDELTCPSYSSMISISEHSTPASSGLVL